MKRPVYIMGDVHGKWEHIIDAAPSMNHGWRNKSLLLQVGDFGLGFCGPRVEDRELNELNKALAENYVELWVIRGNHDDPSRFDGEHIRSNIRTLKDYTVEIINDETYLFVGGALSIDRAQRLEGRSWWEDERMILLPESEWNDLAGAFDVVVTHMAPPQGPPILRGRKSMAVTMAALSDAELVNDLETENKNMGILYDRVCEFKKPRAWYYGHFHESANVEVEGTHFYLLDIDEIRRADK